MKNNIIVDKNPNNEYNKEKVYYCKHCLSLAVIDAGYCDYCNYCGSTDIEEATLEEYDNIYFKRFGKKFFYTD